MSQKMSVTEILKECNISRATLYRLLNEGLPYTQVGVRGKYFDVDTVKEFIANRERGIMLTPGEIITNSQLTSKFHCSPYGKVRKSHRKNSLVIISDNTSEKLFKDYWDNNQFNFVLTNRDIDIMECKELDYAIKNNSSIYLFETFKENELLYRGNIKNLNPPIITEFKIDETNIYNKKVYTFELINSSHLIPEAILDKDEDSLFEDIIKNEEETLRFKAQLNEGIKSQRIVSKVRYERSADIAKYVLKKANGVCELCNENGPFLLKGIPYLEVHCIIPLCNGGNNSIENLVALCPNCHKRMHVLSDKKDIEYLCNKKRYINK